jgi:hypothetical protein
MGTFFGPGPVLLYEAMTASRGDRARQPGGEIRLGRGPGDRGGAAPGDLDAPGWNIPEALVYLTVTTLALALSVRAARTHEVLMLVFALWAIWLLSYPVWLGAANSGLVVGAPDWFAKLNPFVLVYAPYAKPGYIGTVNVAALVMDEYTSFDSPDRPGQVVDHVSPDAANARTPGIGEAFRCCNLPR